MIFDAEAFSQIHALAAASRSDLLLWRTAGDVLHLTGIGPELRADSRIHIEGEGELYIAVPTATVTNWLKGTSGDLEVELDGPVLTLSTNTSQIEVGVVLRGQDIVRLSSEVPSPWDATELGLTAELWEAMDAVSWASASNFSGPADPRMRALHVVDGRVIAMNDGLGICAAVDLGVAPSETFPMIPTTVGQALASVASEEAAVLATSERLWVVDSDATFTAALIAGEPLGNPTVRLDQFRANEVTSSFSVKAVSDALSRLDRVDSDSVARGTDMRARVRLQTVEEGELHLSVLVGDHLATEAIEVTGAPIDLVVGLSLFKSLLGFALDDLDAGLELHHHSGAKRPGPLRIHTGNREAWVMPQRHSTLR
jgi:hypothetical protein